MALCAGVGGLDLAVGLLVADYRTICYVEREAYAASTLVARMADGALDPAPVWDDVWTFRGGRWRGQVDLVTAGFPCTPWSAAGAGRGVEDERWIWPALLERIREIRPTFVFLENVPPLVSRGGLALVLGDLAECGFDAEWDLFAAADVGASHQRERLFVLAFRDGGRLPILSAPHDDDRRDASGDDADRCDADVAHTGRAERWRATNAYDLAGQRPSVHDCGTSRTLADAGAIMADADGDTVRIESERLQREGRRVRAAEREYAVARAPLPLFPPAPADVDGWRRVLAEYPELAPALAHQHMADAVCGHESEERPSDATEREQRAPQRRWSEQSARARAANGDLPSRDESEIESAVRLLVDESSDWVDRALAARVDQLRALGNAVVPVCAAVALYVLAERCHVWVLQHDC